MPDMIAGPGQGLPLPNLLRPYSLWDTPFTPPTNRTDLASGQAFYIPAGTWIIESAIGTPTTGVQWLDPVRQEWHVLAAPIGTPIGYFGTILRSDGFNYRVKNLSGAVQGASVTAGGANYVAATTTVTASAGGSTWKALVGGMLGTPTITVPGANYSIPPIIWVEAPPAPGICAIGSAVITNGQLTAINWTNAGAGYTYPPRIIVQTDPFDPVLLAAASGSMSPSAVIQPAAATVVLTGAGTVTGIMLVNAGTPTATAPTLTVAGQGTGATATVLPATWIAPTMDNIIMQASSGP